jgi:glyoxylate reductase
MDETAPKILFAFPLRKVKERLDPVLPSIGPFEPPITAHLGPEAAEIRALVTMGPLTTDAALMDRLPKLSFICCVGVGYEGVDIAEAKRRGILVANTPGANADAVADLALGFLISVLRQVPAGDRVIREGKWTEQIPPGRRLGGEVRGRKIGIYGYGAIGSKIAERCLGFNAEIGYHGRKEHPGVPHPYFPSLAALAEWADVLMVSVRPTERNRGAVNEAVMRALGPGGILINVARGSVVDEPAMVALLQSGALGGVGLDVFHDEPHVPEALFSMPNAVLTPHIGGATVEAMQRVQDLVLANINAFFSSGKVLTPIPEMAE